MRAVVFAAALLLVACGGSDEPEPDPAIALRAKAEERAESFCRTSGGLKTIHKEFRSYTRTGVLLDIGLDCQCHNGMRFRTPMLVE